MPTDLRRRDEIAAAVAAYGSANPSAPLPRTAARLLTVMFPSDEAGFVSKQRGSACIPDTYRLLLPAEVDAR